MPDITNWVTNSSLTAIENKIFLHSIITDFSSEYYLMRLLSLKIVKE